MMGMHYDRGASSRSLGDTRRKIVPAPKTELPNAIKPAMEEDRSPTTLELLNESKNILGTLLVGLRKGGEDIHKSAQSIANIVKSIAQICNLERAEILNATVLGRMDNSELASYASDLINKIVKTT